MLEEVNRQRHEYNEYYPVEKACAFGSDAMVADFEPLPMLDRVMLESKFPLLELPTLRRR